MSRAAMARRLKVYVDLPELDDALSRIARQCAWPQKDLRALFKTKLAHAFLMADVPRVTVTIRATAKGAPRFGGPWPDDAQEEAEGALRMARAAYLEHLSRLANALASAGLVRLRGKFKRR